MLAHRAMKQEPALEEVPIRASEDQQEDADGNVSGLDELMLLSQSRHLSEEPEKAPKPQPNQAAAALHPGQQGGDPASQPAKADEVRVLAPHHQGGSASLPA